MEISKPVRRLLTQPLPRKAFAPSSSRQPFVCRRCVHARLSIFRTLRKNSSIQRRYQSTNPADQPGFTSIVDNPPTLIRTGRRHNRVGLAILAAIPITAFLLGCWQVQRLGWKSDLIAKFEDRLVRDPLPLPPSIDPDAIKDFDYRRVYARGRFRHDQEMLIGPRLLDGEDGYLVITPLERSDQFPEHKGNSTILVCRGWIAKAKASQSTRLEGLPKGEVMVEGLLREPWKRNMFTPKNQPEQGKWYFPDVYEMAEHAASQPVWIESTMKPDLLVTYDRQNKGVPIGRAAEVNLRNNHAQYIFTWFSLSAATSIMMWMVLRRPKGSISRRIRHNAQW